MFDDMSMSPSTKQEILPTPTSMKSNINASKNSTFFTIDQILGRKEKENVSSDDEVFERDSHDADSLMDDHETVTEDDDEVIEDDDIDVSTDIDGKDMETEKKVNDSPGTEDKDNKTEKQTPSYTAIIAQAILSSSDKKLPLGCIYDYIAENFPEFLKKGQGWRNCVRHNLSLSECFIKAGRARNGRGNYWGIHPRYIKNFSKGDFRKRRASHRPRNRDVAFGYGVGRFYSHYYNPYLSSQSFNKTLLSSHRPGFSVDNILSKSIRDTTTPPMLSMEKAWKKEEKMSPVTGRNTRGIYSPPILSAVVSTTPAYLGQYGYRSTYDYPRTTPECSCHSYKCNSARTTHI